MRLTPEFERHEFACPCCGKDTVDVQTMQALNMTRHHFKQPITITSGFRCVKHNKAIGGSDGSFHLEGKAIDFKVKNTKPRDVYEFLNKSFPDRYGIGFYSTWVHLDCREKKARWAK